MHELITIPGKSRGWHRKEMTRTVIIYDLHKNTLAGIGLTD